MNRCEHQLPIAHSVDKTLSYTMI